MRHIWILHADIISLAFGLPFWEYLYYDWPIFLCYPWSNILQPQQLKKPYIPTDRGKRTGLKQIQGFVIAQIWPYSVKSWDDIKCLINGRWMKRSRNVLMQECYSSTLLQGLRKPMQNLCNDCRCSCRYLNPGLSKF